MDQQNKKTSVYCRIPVNVYVGHHSLNTDWRLPSITASTVTDLYLNYAY